MKLNHAITFFAVVTCLLTTACAEEDADPDVQIDMATIDYGQCSQVEESTVATTLTNNSDQQLTLVALSYQTTETGSDGNPVLAASYADQQVSLAPGESVNVICNNQHQTSLDDMPDRMGLAASLNVTLQDSSGSTYGYTATGEAETIQLFDNCGVMETGLTGCRVDM